MACRLLSVVKVVVLSAFTITFYVRIIGCLIGHSFSHSLRLFVRTWGRVGGELLPKFRNEQVSLPNLSTARPSPISLRFDCGGRTVSVVSACSVFSGSLFLGLTLAIDPLLRSSIAFFRLAAYFGDESKYSTFPVGSNKSLF